MITITELKVISREFLRMITRQNKLQLNDIRSIKYETGTMPRKLVSYIDPNDGLTKQKETPYVNDDEFIIFDVIVKSNIASEVIDNTFKSHMTFLLAVNIYGDEASDEIQFMLSKISTYKVRKFLLDNKISIKEEPKDFEILDGKENGYWWIRRRFEINFNVEQSIQLPSSETSTEFDDATFSIDEATRSDA
jgi:hypothetical protein